MSSYALAFGILGAGLLVAGILWSIPRFRRRRQVRQFRTELAHVDLVALAWRESLSDPDRQDELPSPLPESRRARREQRRRERDGGGDPLV